MVSDLLAFARSGWAAVQERLFFVPPFPDRLDSLALFSLLLVVGLLIGEWMRARFGWPKVIGPSISRSGTCGPHAPTCRCGWRRAPSLALKGFNRCWK